MNIESLYKIYLDSTSVTTDSRNCPQGSIFFALKGESFDGNRYAKSALELGSSYAVVDDANIVDDERYILVDNVLKTLQDLANYHRKQFTHPVVGITGSNGKTTTKELVATALKTKYNVLYTQGNFNNHIGVPLTLLQIKEEHNLAIIEMGANHPKEIAELCAIAEPDYGIITNIGKAHLEGFGGFEGVIKTKKELYDFIGNKGGKVFVNAQDELLMSLSESMNRILYNSNDSKFTVKVKDALPTLALNIASDTNDILQTNLVGDYNAINIAVALEVGAFFNIEYPKMKAALEAYVPSNNRSQIVKTETNTIVLDAYNANPASMAVSVKNFKNLPNEYKIVMLGAMKELGEYSKDEHQALVDMVDDSNISEKYLVGNEFDIIDRKPESISFFATTEDLKNHLKENPITDATILVKGSRSMKMETLTKDL